MDPRLSRRVEEACHAQEISDFGDNEELFSESQCRTARPGQSAARPGVMFPGVTGVHPIAAAVPRPGSSTAHSVLSNTV